MTEFKKKYLHDATEALTDADQTRSIAAAATSKAKETFNYAKEQLAKVEEAEKKAIVELQQARKRYDFAAADLLPLSSPVVANMCAEDLQYVSHRDYVGGCIPGAFRGW